MYYIYNIKIIYLRRRTAGQPKMAPVSKGVDRCLNFTVPDDSSY